MLLVKFSECEVLDLELEFDNGNVETFSFINQLLTRVNDEVNWSAYGLGISMEHTLRLIEEAKRQHKAVRHYYAHIAELLRLYEMFKADEVWVGLDSQEQDLRELEMAA